MKETDLCELLVGWLLSELWEVYQEVDASGGRCDIYAVRGNISWAIEVKTTFGLRVIEQASNWIGRANYVSIAVPRCKSRLGVDICRHYGIGILHVTELLGYGQFQPSVHVEEHVHAQLRRHAGRPQLFEEQKTYAAAGNNRGRYYTPFQGTCDRLRSYVERNPGVTMREALNEIKHHYSSTASARQSLAKWIDAGSVDGLRIERDGKHIRLFPSTK